MKESRPQHIHARSTGPLQTVRDDQETPQFPDRDHRCGLISLALVAITWTVFLQVWSFEFVDLDDGVYVFENHHVLSGLNWENLRWAFSWDATLLTGNWHPLTWLSLMLDTQVFGLHHAGGYHLTNVLIHTASVLVLFAFLLQITGERWKSAFVAALFAVHPLHVESVAWISERKDALSTLFGLVSLWAYGRYARGTSTSLYVIAWMALFLSLLSKQMLVTLPFVFLLLDYWPLQRVLGSTASLSDGSPNLSEGGACKSLESSRVRRTWLRLVIEKTPFFALSFVFCVATLVGQQQANAIAPLTRFSLPLRVSNAVVVYVIYIFKNIWPHNLGCFYPYPEAIATIKAGGAAILLCLITIAAVAQLRRRPYLLLGWLWYLGTLVPVIGLVKAGLPRMADRFTYVPSIGLFFAVTWLVPSLLMSRLKQRRWILPLFSSLIVLIFLTAAWRQTRYWQNSVTLFEHTLSVTEPNDLVHYNLADTYYRQGKVDAAIHHYKQALEIDPQNVGTRNNLGNVLADQRRFEEAIAHFQRVLKEDPNNVPARNNLGIVHHLVGEFEQAVLLFEQVLNIDRRNAQAHLNLGNVLANQGRFEEAIPHFRDALRLNPHLELAQENLRRALAE